MIESGSSGEAPLHVLWRVAMSCPALTVSCSVLLWPMTCPMQRDEKGHHLRSTYDCIPVKDALVVKKWPRLICGKEFQGSPDVTNDGLGIQGSADADDPKQQPLHQHMHRELTLLQMVLCGGVILSNRTLDNL